MKSFYSVLNDFAIDFCLIVGAMFLTSLLTSVADAEEFDESNKPLKPDVMQALTSIQADEIIQHAKIISDRKYMGRKAGRKGSRKAAEYIVKRFRHARLKPGGAAGTYFRSFKIRVGYRISSSLQLTTPGTSLHDLKRKEDYVLVHLPNRKTDLTANIAFAGYGISLPENGFDEYRDIDVHGKVVIVFTGVPWKRKFATSNAEKYSFFYQTLAYKAQNAAKHGAVCMFVVDDPTGWKNQLGATMQLRNPDINSAIDSPIPIVQVSNSFLRTMTESSYEELQSIAYDISQDQQPASKLLHGQKMQLQANIKGDAWVGRNIIGILPGSNQQLNQQAIVFGAHYDHLGIDDNEIFFGANDNASGVSALLGIADAFGKLHEKPKRTLIFIAFDAEEIGKLGSKSFLEHSLIPLENINLMINFDMIGKNEPNQIMAVGTRSSLELHEIHKGMNQHVGLELIHPNSYRLGRSDHTVFFKANIPIMYLFGGLDDDYNTPEDTWDKLIPRKIEKVARLAFLTAYIAANLEHKLKFNDQQQLEMEKTK